MKNPHVRTWCDVRRRKTAPARVKIISWDKRKEMAIVQLTIHEGRNRQVRRMFEALDCKVVKLKRERYAF